MILSFGMSLELRPVEVNFAQIARAVSLRFIIEMRGGRIAALPARRYRQRTHSLAELHHRDEAVSAGAIPFLGSWIWPRSEGSERSPYGGSEPNRNARRRIVERLDDVAVEALESVDVAPWRLPGSEVASEACRMRRRALAAVALARLLRAM